MVLIVKTPQLREETAAERDERELTAVPPEAARGDLAVRLRHRPVVQGLVEHVFGDAALLGNLA